MIICALCVRNILSAVLLQLHSLITVSTIVQLCCENIVRHAEAAVFNGIHQGHELFQRMRHIRHLWTLSALIAKYCKCNYLSLSTLRNLYLGLSNWKPVKTLPAPASLSWECIYYIPRGQRHISQPDENTNTQFITPTCNIHKFYYTFLCVSIQFLLAAGDLVKKRMHT